MNIVKHLHSSLLHKTFDYRGKSIFSVSLLWGFRLDSGDSVLEQDLWTAIGGVLGRNQVFDSAYPKKHAEFLAHGSCFVPSGEPRPAGRVAIELDGLSKDLSIFGDRYWRAGTVTDPLPFTEMPIDFAHAFGGKDHAQNPLGKGMDEVELEQETVRPLPNVECPDALVGSPADRPRPASFGAFDITWPQRQPLMGTYDQKYIETRLPGFADDLDFAFFNDAAPDQWFEGFLQGTESFTIKGMHPQKPEIRGVLPGVYGRCFVDHRVDGTTAFKEIKTRLDTVWFFPAENLGVIIHRGSLKVAEDDGTDILKILIAHENLADSPRDNAHYQDQLARRTDLKEAYKHMLNTVPLIPLGTRCGFKIMEENAGFPLELLAKNNLGNYAEVQKTAAEAQQAEQMAQAQAQLVESGGDPKALQEVLDRIEQAKQAAAPDSPETARLKEIMEKLAPGAIDDPENLDVTKIDLTALDELKEYQEQLVAEKMQENDQRMLEQIAQLREQGAEDAAVQLEQVMVQMKLPPLLPRISGEQIMAALRQQDAEVDKQLMELRAAGLSDEQLRTMLPDRAETKKQIMDGVDKARDAYRLGAHYIDEARSPHAGEEPNIAAALLAAHARKGDTAGGDYAFVDLSGQDLSGIDLSGAYLEYANLTDAKLTGANLSKAILSKANLTNTDFTNADLRDANLGAATLKDTLFVDADLSGAVLGKARIDGARFHRCKMAEKMDLFMEALIRDADFSGSDLRKSVFLDLDFGASRFCEADLSESQFINPVMPGSNFDGANLTSVNFVKAQIPGASFHNAQMKNVRFLGGCTLTGGDFSGADIPEANFRDCELRDAKFNGARLEKTDFGGAQLQNADLSRCEAARTQFAKANLEHAKLERIDLFQGSLRKARISAARFTDANLYNVDFHGCTVGDTDFSGADLGQTLLEHWRPS